MTARPGPGSIRSGRRVAGAVAGLLVTVGALTACTQQVSGSGVAAPGEVAAYRSEVNASAQAAVHTSAVELCRQSMTSMVLMVRGYNSFIVQLNVTHDYAKIGDLDDKARASLIAGADQIRNKLVAGVPEDVAAPARAFVDSTGRLEGAIRRKELTKLNEVATRWSADKQRVLGACATYVPTPPGLGTSTPARPR
ncbi:hypothetical protein [Gordonia sp. ABSL1-1]|uniref:hypothetical protein n=1 Tax=Gordonia sp. ABSL1-1 TaxID=3053923 RepID=UPI0033655384